MIADATTNTQAASIALELRETRRRVGLTRAQVAMLADCSLSMLGAMEAGAVPRRSAVLARVREVLRQQVDDR